MNKKYERFLPSYQQSTNTETFPYFWVMQVHAQYVHQLEKILKKMGLNYSEGKFLHAIYTHPHASISELSERLISKMSTTVKILQRLKSDGLIETYPCKNDARITRVYLTDKGQNTVHKATELTSAFLEDSFSGITPLQLEKLIVNLKTLFNNLSPEIRYH